MRFAILLVLILTGSVIAALFLREENGYALLSFGHWSMETSLVMLAGMVFAGFVALYMMVRLFNRLVKLPGDVRHMAEARGARKAQETLSKGLLALADDRLTDAEHLLTRRVHDSATPLVHYLEAASVAQQAGAYDRRDVYLSLAREVAPKAGKVIDVRHAEAQLQAGQVDAAVVSLEALREKFPRKRHLLALLADAYQDQQQWQKLADLLPALRKQRVIDLDGYQQLGGECYGQLLQLSNSEEQLQETWHQVPKKLREQLSLVYVYVTSLRRFGAQATAVNAVRDALLRQWDEDLVAEFGLMVGQDPKRQLAVAEAWLTDQGETPVLLLTLGRLALANKLWGKARSYLEASIQAGPRADAYFELGRLLEQLEEPGAASQAYRDGLTLGLKNDPAQGASALPAPAGQSSTPVALPAAG